MSIPKVLPKVERKLPNLALNIFPFFFKHVLTKKMELLLLEMAR